MPSARSACSVTPRRLPRTPRRALAHLREADPLMAEVIGRCGPFRLARHPEGFLALCWAIIGQQLSMLAAGRITARFTDLVVRHGGGEPDVVRRIPEAELRACGLSGAKAGTVRRLADFWLEERLNARRLAALPDEEILRLLIPVKGIGPWTVKMYLIFSLHRPDVLPAEDLGLRAGFRDIYMGGGGGMPDADAIEAHAARWRPFRTVATWYCWRHLEWLRNQKNGGA